MAEPPGQFYSRRKWMLFCRCKREYCYHYFLARGGNDPDADLDTRKIHYLKQLKTTPEFLAALLEKMLLQEFRHPSPDGGELLLFRMLGHSLHLMLTEKSRDDHLASVLPFELHRPNRPINLFCDETREQLHVCRKNLQIALKEFGAWAADPLDRESFHFPLSSGWGDWLWYGHVAAWWRIGGRCKILEFLPIDPAESAVFHRHYAMRHLKIDLERVDSLFFDPVCATMTLFDPNRLEIGKTLEEIGRRTGETADFDRARQFLPDASRTEQCQQCRFLEVCKL